MNYSSHSTSTSSSSQGKNYWDVVLNKEEPRYVESSSSSSRSSAYPSSSSSRYSARSASQAVPIAPRGPVAKPREENDGYRFQCPEEGCQQRFRHRSSRSRHKRNSHGR